ncbi:hypothetical protein V1525DRAFT_185569 [Lipomyces kononenkoae]|uniref:Uncharacterized protein n=1 Tax=Lipomyces kononenkoae TaxID=34357 RepID=A0ACC3T0W1_LIPKO
MRRIRRLAVLFSVSLIILIVVLRVTAPAHHAGSASVYGDGRSTNSGSSQRQPFAFSPFMHLANSLTAAGAHANPVLYVAGSTRAASRLIHLANDQAVEFELSTLGYKRPTMHLLFMGPYSVNLEFFARANGANSSCLYIHDGRPKLNQLARLLPTLPGGDSTAAPESLTPFDIAPAATRVALETTYKFLRPEVTIWSRESENNAKYGEFVASLLGDPSSHWAPIDLPFRDMEELRWLAFLGADGLKYWSSHAFDIIIPVTAHTGSLIRLLDSIAAAHYYNLYPRPRITIYLPPGPADPSLINYIERTLAWPRERIFLQSVPPSAFTGQQDSFRETMFATAIRSHVPSSKHAHAIVLVDTVRLSRYWFHWMMFHLLRFSGDVMDTEMTQNLAQLAGISLCPIADGDLPPYFLTQSKLSLSCTLFFPPHFRVLQSYFSKHAADTAVHGVKRTFPVPEKMSFLKNDVKASSTDMHEMLLPLYMRGYLFLSHTSMLAPAVDDLLITAKEKRLEEPRHALLELPLYDWIIESDFHEQLPALDGEEYQWTGLPVIPDWSSSVTSSVEGVSERGVKYINLVSPSCNIVDELSERKPAMEGDERLGTMWRSTRELGIESINRIDDDWLDVFCAVKASVDDGETSENPGRAKTREDEKKERKNTKVVKVTEERGPRVGGKSPKGSSKTVQTQEGSKPGAVRDHDEGDAESEIADRTKERSRRS